LAALAFTTSAANNHQKTSGIKGSATPDQKGVWCHGDLLVFTKFNGLRVG